MSLAKWHFLTPPTHPAICRTLPIFTKKGQTVGWKTIFFVHLVAYANHVISKEEEKTRNHSLNYYQHSSYTHKHICWLATLPLRRKYYRQNWFWINQLILNILSFQYWFTAHCDMRTPQYTREGNIELQEKWTQKLSTFWNYSPSPKSLFVTFPTFFCQSQKLCFITNLRTKASRVV